MRRGFELSLLLVVFSCLVWFAVATMHWPIVSDAAIVRSSAVLLDRGHAPYRDLNDYQMPGSYLVDWAVLHTAGASALAWRLFDFALLGMVGLAAYRIARPFSRFAGLFAGGLFAAFHAHDGVAQTGQRDLTMAALLLLAAAVLLRPPWRRESAGALGWGLLVGFAAALKPTAVLLWPALLLCGRGGASVKVGPRARAALISFGGVCVGPLACVAWVAAHHALPAFRVTLTELIPLHRRLGYAGFGALVRESMAPSLVELAVPASVLLVGDARRAGRVSATRRVLLAGVLFGLISFFVQGSGYPYQRYPMVAFLLLLISLEFALALEGSAGRRWIGALGLVFAAALAPIYVGRGVRERWPAEPVRSLARSLEGVAAPHAVAVLDGDVQCLDSIGGCRTALNDLQIAESTAQLNDEFLFNRLDGATAGERAAVAALRERFLRQLTERPPRVVVVTPWLFPRGPGDYGKLRSWPELEEFLGRCYRLGEERTFPPAPNHATGYRVYLRVRACERLSP